MDSASGGGRFSLWSVLIVAATVGSAAAGAGWQVGRTRLQDELEQYRRSADWGLPETMRQMGELSQKLTLSLEERARLEEAESLRKKVQELGNELVNVRTTLDHAEKKLAEFEGQTFTVLEGTAHFIVPGKLALGVASTNAYTHECAVQFGDAKSTLGPGARLEVTLGGIRHGVVLVEVEGRSCRFGLS